MKNVRAQARAAVAVCLALSLLAGCSGQTSDSQASHADGIQRAVSKLEAKVSGSAVEGSDAVGETDKVVIKDFGSYTVPKGWIESEQDSSQSETYYVAAGTEDQMRPDNIYVEVGTNGYEAEEQESFRRAIAKQLTEQLRDENLTVEGSASITDQGYVLYAFTCSFPRESSMTVSGATATQYYIVGDHRYLLVYETAWRDPEKADRAAKVIINSFVWSEV